jgi:cytochrome c oxidase assembly protein subunit 15/protoheme IX farnesyltransferase
MIAANAASADTAAAAERGATRTFERVAWATLACTVVVVIWGAVVRATGSGAGCGAHWPLCNGLVVPPAPGVATIIEFTHRVTSGLLLIGALGLAIAARRIYPAGHAARRGAALSFIFVVLEALIGAGIVLLRLVENDASALRAAYVAGHLVNTMFLVAALTATVWAARPRPAATVPPQAATLAWLRGALGLLLVVSAAGAVVALGDTLFPGASLAADFDPASHFLIRLRMWHPLLAVGAVIYLAVLIGRTHLLDEAPTRRAARASIALIVLQMALGGVNILMAAPLAVQMAHLAVSNLLWIAVVWLWLQTRADVRRTRPAPGSGSAASRTPR